MMKKLFMLLVAFSMAISLSAQKSFSYSDIAARKFAQKTVSGVRSMADGEHYTVLKGGAVLAYSYADGELINAMCTPSLFGLDPRFIYDYELSSDENKILFTVNSKPLYRHSAYSSYVIYDRNENNFALLSESDSVRYAVFSPNGQKVAFVEGNNIYIRDMVDGAFTQVTRDGKLNHIINGMPDWVYEEEWGIADALRWSPDGEKLAFLRFDESMVKDYSLQFYGVDTTDIKTGLSESLYPRTFTYKYPLAGEKNSKVSLHVFDVRKGKTSRINIGAETDQYVPFFGWTPAGELYYYRINRLQNHLEVFLCGAKGGQKLIYEEVSDKYIDGIDMDMITFLSDSRRFIVRSETRTGYSHLYMYSVDGGLQYPITAGEWEVKNVVSSTDDAVWFVSNETSPMRTNLYVVGTDGNGKKRLTEGEGMYRIAPSNNCKYYLSYFSNSSTPNTVTLHSGDGKLIRTLEDNAALKVYAAKVAMPVKEFFTFPVEYEGRTVELNCYMVRPADFDPSKRYPVLLTQYSGPGSQQVLDRWLVDWEDALVQEGYIVACVDPRGTGGKGEWFQKLTYGKIGAIETEDQIAFARHIASLPYVDPARVGIYGWSYGGFMSLNCILKGSDVFSTAIAVAPVTSWRYYDSVYTERFNGLPETNPEGYDMPSPIFHADKLKGKLLLMHGTADDNVHPQNSHAIALEFVNAGKQFDMMMFTDDNHSMMPYGSHNVRQKMIDYCLKNL